MAVRRQGPLYYALRAAFGGCALYARLRAGVGGGWHGVILILDKMAKVHFQTFKKPLTRELSAKLTEGEKMFRLLPYILDIQNF